jgi:hypothetical protein
VTVECHCHVRGGDHFPHNLVEVLRAYLIGVEKVRTRVRTAALPLVSGDSTEAYVRYETRMISEIRALVRIARMLELREEFR